MYGHIAKLAEAEKKGIEAAGGKADLYQVKETLPQEVLQKMYAPGQDEKIPFITPDILEQHDAFLLGTYKLFNSFCPSPRQFLLPIPHPNLIKPHPNHFHHLGIPTRYGNFPAQWKTFWDGTGKQWQTGSYWGKYGGLFISTGGQGGGQESTAIAAMSTFAHHGIIYVPLGYATAFKSLTNLDEVRGGSAWGAGTFAGGDGSRMPSALELDIAETHGNSFYKAVSKVNFA